MINERKNYTVSFPYLLHTKRRINYVNKVPKQSKSKAKMCNGRRHVPLCPASANEK